MAQPKISFGTVALLLLSAIKAAICEDHVVHEKRDLVIEGRASHSGSRVHPETLLPMRIALQPNQNTSQAEDWLMDVADPDSPNFGRFWSQEAVIEAFKPTDSTTETVKAWLSSHGIHNVTHSDNKQWLAFALPAKDAEALLKTKYFETATAKGIEVSCEHYSLPRDLQSHVDYVKPGVKSSIVSRPAPGSRTKRTGVRPSKAKRHPPPPSELPPTPKHPPKNPDSLARCDREATPACVRALYNFTAPDPSKPVCANNSLGIFEEEELYYQGDLDTFYQHLSPYIPNGTTPIDTSIDGGLLAPKELGAPGSKELGGEPALDLMAAMPIIYPQNATIFQTDDRYYAHRVDYGYLELFNDFLDAIDGSYCTYSAYGETGNSPTQDPQYPDTSHKDGYKGKLQCGTIKPTNVISISYDEAQDLKGPFSYQKRQCNEWLKLALQGVSVFIASGDDGSGCYRINHNHRRIYNIEQTVSCPWVTAVGATQISEGNTVEDPEEAASENWSGVQSGGGFSIVYDTPKYQKSAVQRYFEVSNNASDIPYFTNGDYKGNDGLYNRNGRGIPDISAIGSNIAVYGRGKYGVASGTSASAPIVAGLFNRIVEERLRHGKGPLGLVNPTLYKNPQVLNDITKGWNGECVDHEFVFFAQYLGFNCTKGWDPVTGLGTPRYPDLLKVFINLP